MNQLIVWCTKHCKDNVVNQSFFVVLCGGRLCICKLLLLFPDVVVVMEYVICSNLLDTIVTWLVPYDWSCSGLIF